MIYLPPIRQQAAGTTSLHKAAAGVSSSLKTLLSFGTSLLPFQQDLPGRQPYKNRSANPRDCGLADTKEVLCSERLFRMKG